MKKWHSKYSWLYIKFGSESLHQSLHQIQTRMHTWIAFVLFMCTHIKKSQTIYHWLSLCQMGNLDAYIKFKLECTPELHMCFLMCTHIKKPELHITDSLSVRWEHIQKSRATRFSSHQKITNYQISLTPKYHQLHNTEFLSVRWEIWAPTSNSGPSAYHNIRPSLLHPTRTCAPWSMRLWPWCSDVCACIYSYVYVHVCMCVWMGGCLNIRFSHPPVTRACAPSSTLLWPGCAHTVMGAHMCIRMYMHVYLLIHIGMCVCVSVCVRIYIQIHIHIYIYI